MASSNDAHVTGGGSAPTSAEMVISCAAPARNSAARRHGQLGGAATGGLPDVISFVTAGSAGAFWVVIAGSWRDESESNERCADQASRLT
jgi:hypothetical protein